MSYLVYSISNHGVPQHVGCLPMGEAGALPAVERGSTLTVHHTFNDIDAADGYRRKLVEHWHVGEDNPLRYVRTRIECLTNGTIYRSAAEAARKLDISTALISQHLNNPHRFPTAKGYTFRRITDG